MVLILPLVYMNIFFLFLKKSENYHKSFALTTIVWYSIMLALTELFSAFQGMTKTNIFLAWLFVFFLTLFFNFKIKAYQISLNSLPLMKWEKVFVFIGILWLGLLCFAAIKTVPYNYDSMTYHLSRVANWAQNASVNHYATNIERELFSPVLAEYAVFHTYLLAGGDKFVNCIQLGAYFISLIMVYGISCKLNLTKPFRLISIILCATMPMAVAQSVTTQVDMVGTMWLLIFVYFLLDLVQAEQLHFSKKDILSVSLVALCCAFGYLSKSTVCVSMVVFLVWLAIVRLIKRDSFFTLIRLACCAAFVLIISVCETFIRNYITVGSMFASDNFSSILIATHDPRLILLNLFKNISIQIDSNLFFFLSQGLTMVGNALANMMGVNINDYSIAFNGINYSLISGEMLYHHDTASNPVVVLLALFCIVLLLILMIKKRISPLKRGFCITTVFSFILIASVIKWSPYQTRLMLPATAVLCIYIACTLEYYCKKEMSAYCAATAIAVMSFFEGVDTLVVNVGIPILYQPTHMDGFFCGTRTKQAEAYKEMTSYVKEKGYEEVGILIGLDSYEYPLWYGMNGVTIKHVILDSKSYLLKYVNESDALDCILVIEAGKYKVGCSFTYHGATYQSIWNYKDHFDYAILEKVKE